MVWQNGVQMHSPTQSVLLDLGFLGAGLGHIVGKIYVPAVALVFSDEAIKRDKYIIIYRT